MNDNDLIRRGDAIKAVLGKPDLTGDEKRGIVLRLEALSATDAVEVVRCRECKHCDNRQCYHPNHDHHVQSIWVEEDHFCGWGQRRKEKKANASNDVPVL